jgi:PH domain
MSTYFNTLSTYSSAPPTPSSTSPPLTLQISAPLTADIIKAGFISIKDSWLWGKKFVVLRPVTLSMYKNEKIDAGTPQVVISLNDVINLKREETKDYCFSMEIRGGKIWLFSFKSDGELYGWMDEVYSVSPFYRGYENCSLIVAMSVDGSVESDEFHAQGACWI